MRRPEESDEERRAREEAEEDAEVVAHGPQMAEGDGWDAWDMELDAGD